MSEITALLAAWRGGDKTALEDLTPLVYDELRRRASAQLAREQPHHSMQPTGLVNEVYLKLLNQQQVTLSDRTHFFAVAARMMRQILVDHARATQAKKRGGALHQVSWHEEYAWRGPRDLDVLDLDHALEVLKGLDARQARIVELRFFGGLSVPQAAEVLEISPATVKREWRMARAWLARALARP